MPTLEQQWKDLQLHILEQIAEIDRNTPATAPVPKWWLEMMQVKELVAQIFYRK